eukprot:3940808-Rhodomonas_salina.11
MSGTDLAYGPTRACSPLRLLAAARHVGAGACDNVRRRLSVMNWKGSFLARGTAPEGLGIPRYVLSGTDLGSFGTDQGSSCAMSSTSIGINTHTTIVLRARYAMAGTDAEHFGTRRRIFLYQTGADAGYFGIRSRGSSVIREGSYHERSQLGSSSIVSPIMLYAVWY